MDKTKILISVILLILSLTLGFGNVHAEDEALKFLSQEPIILRLEEGEITVPVTIVSSGDETISNLKFSLLLTRNENGQPAPFESISIQSDTEEIEADSVKLVQLTFQLNQEYSEPINDLTGTLIVIGELKSEENENAVLTKLEPSTRPIIINPLFTDKASINFPTTETLTFNLGTTPITVPIAIENTGTEEIRNLTFELFLTYEENGTIKEFKDISLTSDFFEIQPKAVEVANLTFTTSEGFPANTISGFLIVNGATVNNTPIAASTHPITIKRLRDDTALVVAVVIGALFIATIMVIYNWCQRNDKNKHKLGDDIILEDWSSNGWFSIFTAGTSVISIGAILAIIPKETITQINTGPFVLLSGLFAILILVAPFFFLSTLQKAPDVGEKGGKTLTGKTSGFLLNNLLTLWGAAGQVLTVAIFAFAVSKSRILNVPPIAGYILFVILFFTIIAMIIYASMTIKWELNE